MLSGWLGGGQRPCPPTLELFAGAGASWLSPMAHSGHPWGPQSPSPFRSRREQLGAPPGGHLPYCAEEEEEWETDPDFTQEASQPWREREISTASIISGRWAPLHTGCRLLSGVRRPLFGGVEGGHGSCPSQAGLRSQGSTSALRGRIPKPRSSGWASLLPPCKLRRDVSQTLARLPPALGSFVFYLR